MDSRKRLFIFIGGVDNEDYDEIQRLNGTKGIASWSALKDVRPGDRALIYIAQPHSALIARGTVALSSIACRKL